MGTHPLMEGSVENVRMLNIARVALGRNVTLVWMGFIWRIKSVSPVIRLLTIVWNARVVKNVRNVIVISLK